MEDFIVLDVMEIEQEKWNIVLHVKFVFKD